MADTVVAPPNWSRPQDLNLKEVSGSPEARRDLAARLRALSATETERTDRSGRKLAPRAGIGEGEQNGLVQTALNVLEGRRVVNEDNRGGVFTRAAIGDFQRRFMGKAAVDRVAGRDTYLAMAAALENSAGPTGFVRRAEPERPNARIGIRAGAPDVAERREPVERRPEPVAGVPDPALTVRDRSAVIERPEVANPAASDHTPDIIARAASVVTSLRGVTALPRLTDNLVETQDRMRDAGATVRSAFEQLMKLEGPERERAMSELLRGMSQPGSERPDPAQVGALLLYGQLSPEHTNAFANAAWSRMDDAGRQQVVRGLASAQNAEGASWMMQNYPDLGRRIGAFDSNPIRPAAIADVMRPAFDAEVATQRRARLAAIDDPLDVLTPFAAAALPAALRGASRMGSGLMARLGLGTASAAAESQPWTVRQLLTAASREGPMPQPRVVGGGPASTPAGSYVGVVNGERAVLRPLPEDASRMFRDLSNSIVEARRLGNGEQAFRVEQILQRFVKIAREQRFDVSAFH